MIFGSVCSGIEAASVAWDPMGWRPAFYSEIDAFPRAVLKHRFPEIPLHGDFTTIQAGQYDAIDLLVGGTPCQDFSVAGLRAGLAGERGNLTLEYLRLAGRLRPRWLVWENVPGVLSSDGGRAFGAFLGGLAQLGYRFAWRVLDAQYVRVDGFPRAVPQRRKRVFVVGHLGDWRRAAAVLFERACLSGDPAPRRQAGESVAPTISARPTGGGGLGTDCDLDGGLISVEVAATLDASYCRLQPCSGQDALHVHSHLVAAYGGNDTRGPIDVATAVNAHGVPHGRLDFESETFIAFHGSQDPDISGDVTHPLGLNGGREACIAFGTKEYAQDAGDVSPPLRAMGSNKDHPNGGGQVGIAFALRGRTGGSVPEVSGDVVSALRSASGGSSRDMVAHSLRAEGFDATEDGVGRGTPLVPVGRWAVRRLTPRECERLQGFPDDFTLVPWRKGQAPDGPRYKALGNSMAVNVMRWIGMRIAQLEAMDNLFGEAA